jgi:phage tail-like protein
MDVNGTKLHLLYGKGDWGGLYLADNGDQPLRELWELPESEQPDIEWNQAHSSIQLARQPQLFRRNSRVDPLPLALRRGAGRDRYEHWYWIDEGESGIRFLAHGERTSVQFWSSAVASAACELDPAGGFMACAPKLPERLFLRGLAVTHKRSVVDGEEVVTGHFLVVGNVTQRGLLIFDLHRGGPPNLMQWYAGVPFAPYDIAATPDGGVLILDQDNRRYWRLDSDFRLTGEVETQNALFQPSEQEGVAGAPAVIVRVAGYVLNPPGDMAGRRPVSIETGPDGHALILYTADDRDVPSIVYEYTGDALVATYSLQDVVDVFDPVDETSQSFSINAHDITYTECRATGPESDVGADDCMAGGKQKKKKDDCDCIDLVAVRAGGAGTVHILYVAERDGNQVIAFEMVRQTAESAARLEYQADYLPLRRWMGKGIVAFCGRVYYDFQDRWLPLQVFSECYYAQRAVIETRTTFVDGLPGQPFDGEELGCIWHRLVLDAVIPAGTGVTVRARAADDATLLENSPWVEQPKPYRRSGGAELPYYTAIAELRVEALQAERAGTWELLFQEVAGRYLQIELTLVGTGRSSPELYALRAWYPRFSYLQYLPAIYKRTAADASFLERWLANFEGLYTNLEDKIAQFAMLLDPRIAPAETLEWLGSWMSLVFEPVWSERRRRFFIRHAHDLYQWRGTLPGLEMALRMYLDDECSLDDSLFDLQCLGRGRIRIVELFLLRETGGLVYGDPNAPNTPLTSEQAAHRFTVLLPHDFEDQERYDPVELDDQLRMLQRIVDLEKPAHTEPTLKRYWDMFRVGEARLGLDTRLGLSSRIRALVLGESFLPESHLALPYPFDLIDRVILNRDRLGDLPAL